MSLQREASKSMVASENQLKFTCVLELQPKTRITRLSAKCYDVNHAMQ